MAGALPERRMRALHARRLDDDVLELPEPAAMAERRLRGPGAGDDVDRFLEPRLGFLHGDAEADELVVAIALADAEIEPAAGQQVEGRRLLGEQHRVVPRQDQNGGAEPDGAGAGADPGQ